MLLVVGFPTDCWTNSHKSWREIASGSLRCPLKLPTCSKPSVSGNAHRWSPCPSHGRAVSVRQESPESVSEGQSKRGFRAEFRTYERVVVRGHRRRDCADTDGGSGFAGRLCPRSWRSVSASFCVAPALRPLRYGPGPGRRRCAGCGWPPTNGGAWCLGRRPCRRGPESRDRERSVSRWGPLP